MCAGMLLNGLSPELNKVQFFLSSIFRVQTPLSLLIMLWTQVTGVWDLGEFLHMDRDFLLHFYYSIQTSFVEKTLASFLFGDF